MQLPIRSKLFWGFVTVAVFGYFGCKAFNRSFFGDVGALAEALPKEREAATREGLPLEPSELFPNRPLNPEQNAASVVTKESSALTELVPTSDPVFKAMPKSSQRLLSAQELKDLETAVARAKPQLDAIMAAAKRPYCDFGKDYALGFRVLFPEFAQIKQAVKLLCTRAWLSSREGIPQDTEASLRASFRLADFVSQEPCLIGMLVKIACDAITHRTLRDLVWEHERDPQFLAMAERLCTESVSPVDVRRALAGEIVSGIATIRTLKSFKEIEQLSGNQETSFAGALDLSAGFMREAWQTRHIQFWRRVFKRLPKDPEDFTGIAEVLRTEQAAEESHKSLDYLMNKIMSPVFDQAMLAGAKDHADRLLSLVSARLFQFRKQHGKFPASLKEVGGPYKDPFDTKPLRYRRTPSGFVLYSVDRDLKDDGGAKPKSGASFSDPRDFVVDYPKS